MRRIVFFALAFPLVLCAAPPAAVVTALEHLRDQRSYSWEVINGDPGPVAQNFETRRGTVTTVQQNTSPHVAGSIDVNGDMLLEREWSDGLRLETLVTADGAMITNTPEGWMTNQEILTAQADERLRDSGQTPRSIWLRRADRPDVRRPDQELVSLLSSNAPFEEVSLDTFVTRGRVRPNGTGKPDDDDAAGPAFDIAITLHLRDGVVRDYEVSIEGSRAVTRARVQMPVSDHRIVIITYLPVRRIDVPAEAREKLKAPKSSAR